MSKRSVIIFGPTGDIGSAAVQRASQLGSRVVLAMRMPSKPIPGLNPEQEEKGDFQRIQADLNDANSVKNAVISSHAKRAFIYCAHGSPDNMRSAIEALKEGGIEQVILLSSFTVHGKTSEVPQSEPIPFHHAAVEVQLEEVFGKDGFVTIRPGAFAKTVIGRFSSNIREKVIKLRNPKAQYDCVTTEDIGEVSGTVLVQGAKDGQREIYVYGNKILSGEELVNTIAKSLGVPIPKIEIDDSEVGSSPLMQYLARRDKISQDQAGESQILGYPVASEDMANVERYTGHKAMTLEKWIEKHKDSL